MSKTASRNAITKRLGFNLSSHKQAFIDDDAPDDCLQVIGVGLPRCGTTSLKRALEILGFDPCHHMVDCIDYPIRSTIFTSLINSQDTSNPSSIRDLSRLATLKKAMKGYKSTVDAPVCDLYRELTLIYPEAKFILSTRDNPEIWWKSFTSTIATELSFQFRILTMPIPFIRKQCTLIRAIVHKWDTQGGGYSSQKYVNHLQEVREWIPRERLLEFNVKEGWAPLCGFLGVEVPEEGFPHLNDTKEIKATFLAAQVMGGCVWIAGIGVVAGAIWLAIAPPTFVKDLLTSLW